MSLSRSPEAGSTLMSGLKKPTRPTLRDSISITPREMADLPLLASVAVMYRLSDPGLFPSAFVILSTRSIGCIGGPFLKNYAPGPLTRQEHCPGLKPGLDKVFLSPGWVLKTEVNISGIFNILLLFQDRSLVLFSPSLERNRGIC